MRVCTRARTAVATGLPQLRPQFSPDATNQFPCRHPLRSAGAARSCVAPLFLQRCMALGSSLYAPVRLLRTACWLPALSLRAAARTFLRQAEQSDLFGCSSPVYAYESMTSPAKLKEVTERPRTPCVVWSWLIAGILATLQLLSGRSVALLRGINDIAPPLMSGVAHLGFRGLGTPLVPDFTFTHPPRNGRRLL